MFDKQKLDKRKITIIEKPITFFSTNTACMVSKVSRMRSSLKSKMSKAARSIHGPSQNMQPPMVPVQIKWQQEAKKELTEKEKAVQDAAFDSWKFGFFKPTGDQKALCDASGSQLALMDKEELTDTHWLKAQPQLATAIQAFEKLDKDAKKSLQIVGVGNKTDKLYTDLMLFSFLARICWFKTQCMDVNLSK